MLKTIFPWRHAVLASALTLMGTTAFAHEYELGDLSIGHPWARATVAGQQAGGGYLSVNNKGKVADRLIGASMAGAQSVELHQMSMEGDVMKMRRVELIDLPAGEKVELKPGGLHLMLMGLKAPLALGSKVPVTLVFQKAGPITVELAVEAVKPAMPASAPAHQH